MWPEHFSMLRFPSSIFCLPTLRLCLRIRYENLANMWAAGRGPTCQSMWVPCGKWGGREHTINATSHMKPQVLYLLVPMKYSRVDLGVLLRRPKLMHLLIFMIFSCKLPCTFCTREHMLPSREKSFYSCAFCPPRCRCTPNNFMRFQMSFLARTQKHMRPSSFLNFLLGPCSLRGKGKGWSIILLNFYSSLALSIFACLCFFCYE
jgi:hypothetical protein